MPSNKKNAMYYRPDVDGLRGIAVLLVLLFHAGFEQMAGGYVGVDVFFVISGYLITGVLHRNCQDGNFSYFGFLSKRFFRLYPALIVSLLITIAVGYLLLSTQHLYSLGHYTLAALSSAANIVFFQSSGYFSEAAATNPVLHTWSLGVEQQFYLFWPFIILFCYKRRFLSLPVGIMAVGATSLLYSQYALKTDPTAAYFLVQFRIFEFAIGAFLASVEKFGTVRNWIMEILLALGLLTLVSTAMAFNQDTTFPGFYALLPCSAAAVCIYAGRARYLGVLLRNRGIVSVGLISYSLYLVHWPIISYYKYFSYAELTRYEKYGLVLASFIVAYPLWRGVENKYRRVEFAKLGAGGIFVGLSVLSLIVVFSFQAVYTNGVPSRIGSDVQAKMLNNDAFHSANYSGDEFRGVSVLGDPNQTEVSAILLGDSFAGNLTRGLHDLLRTNGLKAVSIWQSGCLMGPSFVTVKNGVADAACVEAADRALDVIKKHNVPLIIAQSWDGTYNKNSGTRSGKENVFSSQTDYLDFAYEHMEELHRYAGRDRFVIVFGSPPGDGSINGVNLRSCLERPTYFDSPCLEHLSFTPEKGFGYSVNEYLASRFRAEKRQIFLNPYDYFCKGELCLSMPDDRIAYTDAVHLTNIGSHNLVRHFGVEILKVINNDENLYLTHMPRSRGD